MIGGGGWSPSLAWLYKQAAKRKQEREKRRKRETEGKSEEKHRENEYKAEEGNRKTRREKEDHLSLSYIAKQEFIKSKGFYYS